MPHYLHSTEIIILSVICVALAAAWSSWAQYQRARQVLPKWRGVATVFGLGSGTFSSILSIFLLVHAAYTGGYPVQTSRIEAFCIVFGFFSGLLGLLAALLGRGLPRICVALLSACNLCFWLLDAATQ
jgi:hypothetical protein